MNTFFISDTHFNHSNIIRLANRPYIDVEEMNESLVKNWNDTVGEFDHVYFLGDFCWPTETRGEGYWFHRLNGIKKLIIGNHDNVCRMNELPWDMVEYYHEFKINKNRFVLLHYPISEGQWNGGYKGNIHIHGHTHSHDLVSGKKRFCVSVEAIGYKPIEIEEILQKV